MKALIGTVAVVLAIYPVGASGQVAAPPMSSAGPRPIVDLFTCSYVDGHGMDDFLAVVARWNTWADGHEVSEYSGYIMTPWRFPDRGVDVAWLGVWSSGSAMARVEALWLAEGAALRAELDEVVDCPATRQFVGMEVAASARSAAADIGVMGFRNCWVHEERALNQVLEAMNRWSAHLNDRGHFSSQGLLFRVAGSMLQADFSFKLVEAFGTLADYGEFLDIYSSDGAAIAEELFDPVMYCDNRRAFLVRQVRGADLQ